MFDKIIPFIKEIDAVDRDGKTCLHYICENDNIYMFNCIIGRIKNINLKSGGMFKYTCLYEVCKNNNFFMFKNLIDKGVHVDIESLFLIIKNSYFFENMVKNNNFNVNEYYYEYGNKSIPQIVVCDGTLNSFDILLKNNNNINWNHQDVNGETLIHTLCRKNNYSYFKLLDNMDINVDILNNNGMSPLHISCSLNNFEQVQWLTEKSAYLEHIDNDKRKPIDCTNDVLIRNYILNLCMIRNTGKNKKRAV